MRYKALRAITLSFLICLFAFPVAASAQAHFSAFAANHAVVVRYPYRGWGGWGWGWGGWGWDYPYWGGFGPYYLTNYRGEIKIKDANKYDHVYLNGAYAGTVDKLKNMWLDPGRYKIEVRERGKDIVNREVYIVAGKKVDIYVNNNE